MQTVSYLEALHRLRNSGPHMHNGRYMETPVDIENYFRKYLGIAVSIRSRGFQTDQIDALL